MSAVPEVSEGRAPLRRSRFRLLARRPRGGGHSTGVQRRSPPFLFLEHQMRLSKAGAVFWTRHLTFSVNVSTGRARACGLGRQGSAQPDWKSGDCPWVHHVHRRESQTDGLPPNRGLSPVFRKRAIAVPSRSLRTASRKDGGTVVPPYGVALAGGGTAVPVYGLRPMAASSSSGDWMTTSAFQSAIESSAEM